MKVAQTKVYATPSKFTNNFMKLSKINPHYLAGITCFSIWGFLPIVIKSLAGYASPQILYFRVTFAFIILLAISLTVRKKSLLENLEKFKALDKNLRTKNSLLIVFSGILLAVNWLVFIFIVNNVGVQAGTFAYLICPIETALLGYLILREKLSPKQWIAIGLSSVACVMLGQDSLPNLGYVLLTSSTYALFLITQRRIFQFDKMTLLMVQLAVACIIILPLYSFFNPNLEKLDSFFFGMILLLAVVFTIIPLFLNMFALKELTSASVAILMYINPILNFILAILVYQEVVTLFQSVAYLLIASAVLLNILNK
ncbi:MAG: permease [Bacteroidetes bacterium]|nr:MAG: permease [Bacteroidota bacterium]